MTSEEVVTPEPSEATRKIAELARAEYAEFLKKRELPATHAYRDFAVDRSLHRYEGLCLALAHLLVQDGVIQQRDPLDIDGINWLLGRPQEERDT